MHKLKGNPMSIQMLNVEGIDLRIRDSGGDGPVLFLSSGVAQSLEFWDAQFAALSGECRLIAWDYPDHGLSGPGPAPYTLASLTQLSVQVLDALGIEQAIFVGNSLGGAVSVRAAALAPERVSGLVLAAPAMFGREVFFPFRLFTLPVLGMLMNKPSEKGVEMQIASVFHPSFTPPEALRSAIRRNVFKEGAVAPFVNFMRDTLTLGGAKPDLVAHSRAALRGAQCPVLFVHGADDKVLPCSQSRQNADLARNGRFVLFDECGHAPQTEKPKEFNNLIREFIGAQ